MKGIEGHARIPPPGWEDIQAEAAISGITPEAALDKLLRMRAAQIAAEEADPMRNGWDPPIWHVADALLGFPYCNDQPFLREIKRRLNFTWEEFCERMRKYLKYDRPVKMLLILGGNRGSKSEYPAKRGMMMSAFKDNARIYAMHMSEPRSKRDQQPLFWKYMPVEWQIQTAGLTAYIKYKKKTGFAENSFITPNGSEGVFLNYMQDKDTALQGMEADMVAPDELIPADWVEDILLRLATRAGVGILTFTPINGYTPTVKMFCDGATVVQTISAYLCPRDGGEPDEALSLNLTAGQYAELWQAVDQHRAAMTAQSEPEDVIAWIEEGTEAQRQKAQSKELDSRFRGNDRGGRMFEELPRVMKCKDPRKAVVFFNPSDNPYGNPKEVIADLRKKARGYIRERFYGQAERTISVLIPKFNEKIHVIPASRIPTGGTNYFFYDPASDRNSFMSWFKRCGKKAYLYREWPGQYHIPGVGSPGPWAIPSGRKDGLNDGAKGEGQGPWGFGNLRYKFEMARLEGWEDWRKWKEGRVDVKACRRVGVSDEYPEDEELEKWDERSGAKEIITARFIDSRAASAPRIEKDRPVTLQTLFDEINVFFFLTPGADIIDGVSKINSALDYELEEPTPAKGHPSNGGDQKFINEPDFFVSEECENSIYALESWMNADGQNGACKDPIDLIRYFFMADCEDVGPGDYAPRGGVAYGGQHSEVRGPEGRIRYKRRRLPV